jgi:hypothetical protein
MRVSITIKKSPDHPLILRAMEARLSFEEIDASFRKCNRDLLRILTKYQFTGWRKKIFNNTQTPKRLICVAAFAKTEISLFKFSAMSEILGDDASRIVKRILSLRKAQLKRKSLEMPDDPKRQQTWISTGRIETFIFAAHGK